MYVVATQPWPPLIQRRCLPLRVGTFLKWTIVKTKTYETTIISAWEEVFLIMQTCYHAAPKSSAKASVAPYTIDCTMPMLSSHLGYDHTQLTALCQGCHHTWDANKKQERHDCAFLTQPLALQTIWLTPGGGGVTCKKCAYHVSSSKGHFKYLKLLETYLKREFSYYILNKNYIFE